MTAGAAAITAISSSTTTNGPTTVTAGGAADTLITELTVVPTSSMPSLTVSRHTPAAY